MQFVKLLVKTLSWRNTHIASEGVIIHTDCAARPESGYDGIKSHKEYQRSQGSEKVNLMLIYFLESEILSKQ